MVKKKSVKKTTKKKAVKKSVDKKPVSNKSLSPEELKTKLKKLYAGLAGAEDQKEKKNIRAKLRTTAKNWKDILGIKTERASKKKVVTKSTKKVAKQTKKKAAGKKQATT